MEDRKLSLPKLLRYNLLALAALKQAWGWTRPDGWERPVWLLEYEQMKTHKEIISTMICVYFRICGFRSAVTPEQDFCSSTLWNIYMYQSVKSVWGILFTFEEIKTMFYYPLSKMASCLELKSQTALEFSSWWEKPHSLHECRSQRN